MVKVEPELSSMAKKNKRPSKKEWHDEIEIKMVTNLTAGD